MTEAPIEYRPTLTGLLQGQLLGVPSFLLTIVILTQTGLLQGGLLWLLLPWVWHIIQRYRHRHHIYIQLYPDRVRGCSGEPGAVEDERFFLEFPLEEIDLQACGSQGWKRWLTRRYRIYDAKARNIAIPMDLFGPRQARAIYLDILAAAEGRDGKPRADASLML